MLNGTRVDHWKPDASDKVTAKGLFIIKQRDYSLEWLPASLDNPLIYTSLRIRHVPLHPNSNNGNILLCNRNVFLCNIQRIKATCVHKKTI